MKKHYIFKFILLLIPVLAFLLISSSGGRSDGRSGSPGDGGNSCASCHSGGSSGVSASISTDIPAGGYALNTTYNITVNSTASAAGGFQLTAENDADAKIGSFTAGSGSRVEGQRITHSNSGNNSWSFTWKSPTTDQGNIKFYAATVIANGDGSNGGDDKAATTSTSGSTVLSIPEAKRFTFDMFPNPASENVTIQLASGSEEASVEFYDYIGRLALTKKVSQLDRKIDIQALNAGIYILKVVADGKIGTQKFIKQ